MSTHKEHLLHALHRQTVNRLPTQVNFTAGIAEGRYQVRTGIQPNVYPVRASPLAGPLPKSIV
jgi:hypothetical protein